MPLIITRNQKDFDILVECGMDSTQKPVEQDYTEWRWSHYKSIASRVTFKVTQDIVDRLDLNNRHDNTMQLI